MHSVALSKISQYLKNPFWQNEWYTESWSGGWSWRITKLIIVKLCRAPVQINAAHRNGWSCNITTWFLLSQLLSDDRNVSHPHLLFLDKIWRSEKHWSSQSHRAQSLRWTVSHCWLKCWSSFFVEYFHQVVRAQSHFYHNKTNISCVIFALRGMKEAL